MRFGRWFGGHKILTSAKVQRSETFADVNVFKLKTGLTNDKDWAIPSKKNSPNGAILI